MLMGHNNIVCGCLRNFSVPEWLYENVCNAIRFRGYQNNENMSKGTTYRTHEALQLLSFDLYLMKQYNFRINPYV